MTPRLGLRLRYLPSINPHYFISSNKISTSRTAWTPDLGGYAASSGDTLLSGKRKSCSCPRPRERSDREPGPMPRHDATVRLPQSTSGRAEAGVVGTNEAKRPSFESQPTHIPPPTPHILAKSPPVASQPPPQEEDSRLSSSKDAALTMLQALDPPPSRGQVQLAQVYDLLGWNDEKMNGLAKSSSCAYDDKFVSYLKSAHTKTSSPQRKLGSRPSHRPAIEATPTSRQIDGGRLTAT